MFAFIVQFNSIGADEPGLMTHGVRYFKAGVGRQAEDFPTIGMAIARLRELKREGHAVDYYIRPGYAQKPQIP